MKVGDKSWLFAKQGRPVVISEVGDAETHDMVKQHLDVPHTVDCLQGIVTVIPMQLLSLHIAERRNLDVSVLLCESGMRI